MRNKSVVITGGGTGGHLKVADAFIEEFSKRGFSVIFIGSSNGQDSKWFEEDKRLKKAFFLDTKGVVNKGIVGKIKSISQILSHINKCRSIFSKYKIKRVISVGGYSAAPASFTAILNGDCHLFIHEQNSLMGKLNKITSRFATEVYSSYEPNSAIKDYPVSDEFFDNARIRDELKTIIFLGGSQGAKAINDFAMSIAKDLKKINIEIIHQTGKDDYDRVKKFYDKENLEIDVFAFSKELAAKMNKADFAVSRAGASTLWELCANSLPTLFIPYPYAAQDHQYTNAKFLEEKGLCYILREHELSREKFIEILKKDNYSVSKKLVDSIRYNAIESIVDDILEKS
ncbi:undecaprenyldiphospho-muramoylpentapeptide beta-N-acetylglucosaminyltransferase [Halarcobacter mediterraneus]|uniref:UDP-N-acetylglucosamine--N-acetylmuramyl-(pentapeptide) pyrophosphoryl-undecaprenol N-acetylglucosamine transferase n=1 Tax=Halarcobacter mediterraneus TaxID=2023153 RepID=A0A4Q1ASX8_9BACT|nr:undecaprenyldiphospho-muramoylpentapeptide beta-N-acetylglucosaminyltransferase [Halarcobacter mediterraneus]RXK11760.1 undecaprenyldiphospho-muramoylpentapeptide beta-N-acetylglucosaminyltransferase [Halarcobacter mediterraneus]